jgi:Bacterial SH3 domain
MNSQINRCITIMAVIGLAIPLRNQPSFADDNSNNDKICVVNDPTGSPLNYRIKPNGGIMGQLTNGTEVKFLGTVRDKKGKMWAKVSHPDSENDGYVLRKFIKCPR